MAKRFGKVKTYAQWRNPKLVENALELLETEIPKYRKEIKFVHLCFMTDPFMYGYTEVRNLTLRIIEKLNQNRIRCTVLTKGILSKELVNKDKYGENNEYGITLVSLDKNFKKTFEPYSAPYQKRINALKRLTDNGLKTWVSIEPYPTPNIVNQDLLRILKQVSFVDKVIFGKLNYNVKTSKFKDNKEFYQECSNIVKEFCTSNGIEFHIKYGTEKTDNKTTESIFRKAQLPESASTNEQYTLFNSPR
jgi:DNA repair photolyase